MTIIFRHSFKILVTSFLLITLAVAGVAWLVKSPQLLEIVLLHGVPLHTFLTLSLHRMPSFLELLLPLSFLFATLYTLHHLTVSSELIAMRASGQSHAAIAKPILVLAFIVSLFSLFITFYATPSGYRIVRDIQHYVGTNLLSSPIKTGQFSQLGNSVLLYLPQQSNAESRKGLFIYDGRKKDKEITLMAQEAQLQKISQGVRFKLVNGTRQEFTKNNKQLSEFAFDYYIFDLDAINQAQKSRSRRIEERYLHELLLPQDDVSKETQRDFISEIHRRVLLPFSVIVYALLAMAIFSAKGVSRGDSTRSILMISVVASAVHVMLVSFVHLNRSFPFLAIIAYVTLTMLAVICTAYLYHPVPFDHLAHRLRRMRFRFS